MPRLTDAVSELRSCALTLVTTSAHRYFNSCYHHPQADCWPCTANKRKELTTWTIKRWAQNFQDRLHFQKGLSPFRRSYKHAEALPWHDHHNELMDHHLDSNNTCYWSSTQLILFQVFKWPFTINSRKCKWKFFTTYIGLPILNFKGIICLFIIYYKSSRGPPTYKFNSKLATSNRNHKPSVTGPAGKVSSC